VSGTGPPTGHAARACCSARSVYVEGGPRRADQPGHGGLNITFQALDRHVAEGRGEKLAMGWLGKNGEKRDISYGELLALSCRSANVLRDLGVG
jgi:hypothetical protein